MFQVSDEYKQAIASETRDDKIQGTILLKNGTSISFTDSDIIGDSLKIDNQSISGEGLNYGTVYAGQLSMNILSEIDRYSLFDARISLSHYLLVGEEYAEVPLGVFNVDEATRAGTVIQLTALDDMTRLDKNLANDANGTWWDMLCFIADECGIELAQTQEEIESLHLNAPVFIYSFSSDTVGTYRDALGYMCSCICAFAVFDRYGKLKICTYSQEVNAINDTDSRLLNCKFSDYETQYVGVKARFVDGGSYKEYKKANNETGMVLDLGDIPIVGGLPDAKQGIIDAIYETVVAMVYVPSTLSIPPNPTYDLGDRIQCDNINSTADSVITYVMHYSYAYRKNETLESKGENPRLQNVSSQEATNQAQLEAQIDAKDMIVTLYTNISEYSVKQELKNIIEFNYSTFKDCNPMMIATIPFELDVDGYVEFTFYNALIPIQNACYTQYYTAGKNFATISIADTSTENERRTLRVYCRTYRKEDSEVRRHDAKISTIYNFIDAVKNQNNSVVNALETATAVPITGLNHEISYLEVTEDLTEPILTISKQQIHAVLYAQGINGKSEWDGTLNFTEEISNIVPKSNACNFGELLDMKQQVPIGGSIAELIPKITAGSTIAGFGAVLNAEEKILSYTIDKNTKGMTYNSDIVSKENGFELKSIFTYESKEEAVDSGRMTAVTVDTEDFTIVESVVVESDRL